MICEPFLMSPFISVQLCQHSVQCQLTGPEMYAGFIGQPPAHGWHLKTTVQHWEDT